MLSAYILTSTSFQGTDWLEKSHPREKSCIPDNIQVDHTVLSTIASSNVQKKNVKLMLKWYQLSIIRAVLHAHDITKSNINVGVYKGPCIGTIYTHPSRVWRNTSLFSHILPVLQEIKYITGIKVSSFFSNWPAYIMFSNWASLHS